MHISRMIGFGALAMMFAEPFPALAETLHHDRRGSKARIKSSKWSNAELREINARNGVGNPRKRCSSRAFKADHSTEAF